MERNIKSVIAIIVSTYSGFLLGHLMNNIDERNIKMLDEDTQYIQSISKYISHPAENRCSLEKSKGCGGCVILNSRD